MRALLSAALTLSLCWLTLPGQAQLEPVAQFALVVGNNYAPDRRGTDLRWADDDAVATHLLLQEAGVDSTILTTPDADTRVMYPELHYQPATLERVEQVVSEIAKKVSDLKARGGTSEFFFFYSGHGDENDSHEGYVALERRGQLTRSKLLAVLTRVGATRNHVIVDACKSSLLVIERGHGGTRRPYTGQPLVRAFAPEFENTGLILSTSSGRDTHEWERYHAGILSHELRSALRGAADVDHDSSISYAELGAFLGKANQGIVPYFRPDFMVRGPGNNFAEPLLTWRSAASIELPAEASWGHVYVEAARGERVADVHPAPHEATFLWLPSQRPLFLSRYDQSAELVIASAASQQRVDPGSARPPTTTTKGAPSAAFEQLFTLPFAAADVERYRPAASLSVVSRAEPPMPNAPAAPAAVERAGDVGPLAAATWVAAGSTVLFGASAVAFGVATLAEGRRTQRFAERCQCGAGEVLAEQATGKTFQTIANVSWVGFGVSAALTITGLVLVTSARTKDSAVLSVGPGSVQLSGQF